VDYKSQQGRRLTPFFQRDRREGAIWAMVVGLQSRPMLPNTSVAGQDSSRTAGPLPYSFPRSAEPQTKAAAAVEEQGDGERRPVPPLSCCRRGPSRLFPFLLLPRSRPTAATLSGSRRPRRWRGATFGGHFGGGAKQE
jgi:hypothetical protein